MVIVMVVLIVSPKPTIPHCRILGGGDGNSKSHPSLDDADKGEGKDDIDGHVDGARNC